MRTAGNRQVERRGQQPTLQDRLSNTPHASGMPNQPCRRAAGPAPWAAEDGEGRRARSQLAARRNASAAGPPCSLHPDSSSGTHLHRHAEQPAPGAGVGPRVPNVQVDVLSERLELCLQGGSGRGAGLAAGERAGHGHHVAFNVSGSPPVPASYLDGLEEVHLCPCRYEVEDGHGKGRAKRILARTQPGGRQAVPIYTA